MNQAINLAKELQSMRATEVIRNERVKAQFINVYNSIWKEGGENVYEREAIYFNQQLRDNEKLRKCTGLSVYYAFIDLAVRGLTLSPGPQCQCYLLPRNCKVGIDQNGRDIWEAVCNLTISAYGELTLRTAVGQIKYADNPVIVYEDDTFSYGERDGHKFVNYACAIPHTSDKIVACFIKITRADGSVDYSVMTEQDWSRLQSYSAKNNTFIDRRTGQRVSQANALYSANNGQIDPGFLIAKCVKHAFKTYPKIKIGVGSALESEVVDEPQQPEEMENPYGFDVQNAKHEESFAQPQDMSAGVTVNTDEEEDDGTF